MRVIDAFWIGRIGFIKFTNGFETKIRCGAAQGLGEREDTNFIIENGADVPGTYLAQFLDLSNLNAEYVAQEDMAS